MATKADLKDKMYRIKIAFHSQRFNAPENELALDRDAVTIVLPDEDIMEEMNKNPHNFLVLRINLDERTADWAVLSCEWDIPNALFRALPTALDFDQLIDELDRLAAARDFAAATLDRCKKMSPGQIAEFRYGFQDNLRVVCLEKYFGPKQLGQFAVRDSVDGEWELFTYAALQEYVRAIFDSAFEPDEKPRPRGL